MTEQKILKLIAERNSVGMQLLFAYFFDAIFNFAYKLTSNKEDSEDIVQTVFIDLWEKGQYRNIKDLKAYLFQMTKYQVYKTWSKRDNITELLEEYHETIADENVYSIVEHAEIKEEVNNIVNTLPNACRQIFELSRYEGLSHDEIASKLNLSKQTVKNQLSKALSILKKELYKKDLINSSSLIIAFLLQI
ncbi:sigma-70 family RNA polymerase sigma factor [Limibacter armeniacum]|uniref:RNA polymerase sigma factor n=1 Tax=Limibacter armeniacum TaxID=466084 RepID=UPI002FE50238